MNKAFDRLKPCLAPGEHKFIVARPNAGDFGYALIICERCGRTRAGLAPVPSVEKEKSE